MKRICVLLFLLSFISVLKAQDQEDYSVQKKCTGHVLGLGTQFSFMGNLNQVLEESGLEKSPTTFFYISDGIGFRNENHITRLELKGYFAGANRSSDLETCGLGYEIQLNYGYSINLGEGNMSLQPYLGFSRCDYFLVASKADESFKLFHSSYGIEMGGRWLFNRRKSNYFALVWSYTLPVYRDWDMGGLDVSFDPEINVSKFKIGVECFLTSKKAIENSLLFNLW